jgi:glycosyltransferase involved in cell wall biosynthesis
MNPLVSICIPTYNRPELVMEAVASAQAQTYRPIEILVSDDSSDDATEQVLNKLICSGVVRYWHHRPAKRQAGNVNHLFEQASGDRLLLLHDDDVLLPDAVSRLAACWEEEPDITAAFGKQYLIRMDGVLLQRESEELNEAYQRTSAFVGRQSSAIRSALTAQFPNDGYLILATAARAVRYRDTPDVGDACDLDFGLRLAGAFDAFYYLDEYIMKYRLTDISVSHSKNYADCIYYVIESASVPAEIEEARRHCLRKYAVSAVHKSIQTGNRQTARRIFLSRNYPAMRRFSPEGLFQMLLLSVPGRVADSGYTYFKQRRGIL